MQNAISRKLLSLNECRINKESEDPESTRDFRIISGRVSEVRERVSESGFERADVLRVRVFAQGSSMQSLGHAESQGLFSLFF